jgi:hypothetical protein
VGQKVHPKGFRIGIIRDWDSNWYADRDYTDLLHEDYKLRNYIKDHFYTAGISKVEIQRTGNRVRITIHTAKPGIVIGRGGMEVEKLKADLIKMTGKSININIQEIKKPELDALVLVDEVPTLLLANCIFTKSYITAWLGSIPKTLSFNSSSPIWAPLISYNATLGTFLTSFVVNYALTESLIITRPFLGPGIDPLIKIRFLSG